MYSYLYQSLCSYPTLFYRVFSCRKTSVTPLSPKALMRIIWRSDLCWLIYVLLLFSRESCRHLGRVEKRLLMWCDSLATEENEKRERVRNQESFLKGQVKGQAHLSDTNSIIFWHFTVISPSVIFRLLGFALNLPFNLVLSETFKIKRSRLQ